MRGRLALVGATIACGAALAVPASAQAANRDLQQRMLGAVNEVRAKHGLGPFRGAGSLNRSASRYARWMLRADYFGHLARIRASSRFSLLGENLAWHSGRRPRVARTVRLWMNSSLHRALILHPSFRWLGAGVARGRLYGRRATSGVLHFGGPLRPSGAAVSPPAAGDQLLSEESASSAPLDMPATTSAAGTARASAAP